MELKILWMMGNEFNNSGHLSRLYVLYQNLKALDEKGHAGRAMAELGRLQKAASRKSCTWSARCSTPSKASIRAT
jgi:hypothetical protein